MMRLRIRIKPAGLVQLDKTLAILPEAIERGLRILGEKGLGRMKDLAQPAGGSHLSMLELIKKSALTFWIGASGKAAGYSPYLNWGTDPSRGRFIKAFGKRFSAGYLESHPSPAANEAWIGMHPGNKGKFGPDGLQFLEGAVEYMETIAEDTLQTEIQLRIDSA